MHYINVCTEKMDRLRDLDAEALQESKEMLLGQVSRAQFLQSFRLKMRETNQSCDRQMVPSELGQWELLCLKSVFPLCSVLKVSPDDPKHRLMCTNPFSHIILSSHLT